MRRLALYLVLFAQVALHLPAVSGGDRDFPDFPLEENATDSEDEIPTSQPTYADGAQDEGTASEVKKQKTTSEPAADPTPPMQINPDGEPVMASITVSLKNKNAGVRVDDQAKRRALDNVLDGMHPILESRRVKTKTVNMFSIFIERGEKNKQLHLQGVVEFISDAVNNTVQLLKRELRWLRALIKRFCNGLSFILSLNMVEHSRTYSLGYTMKVNLCATEHSTEHCFCEHGGVAIASPVSIYLTTNTEVSWLNDPFRFPCGVMTGATAVPHRRIRVGPIPAGSREA